MALEQVSLTNFRSYADRTVKLDPRATLIVGPNATGKTNFLEALYVFATTKSFRAKDAELIRHGETFYRIHADINGEEVSLSYQNDGSSNQKRAARASVRRSLVDHLGTLRAVLFEPNDLLLIYGTPERRRRYLDFILTQTDKNYLKTLHNYRRVLAQRNRILADWQGRDDDLFAWNLKLAELAAELDARRRKVVEHINNLATEIYGSIAGQPEELIISYEGFDSQDYASDFLAQLESNTARDIAAGFTTIGPHRDDFDIDFKNKTIESVASRGEMRTVVLTLKLAELEYFKAQTGSKPILLLDDVFSELDERRRGFLVDTLADYQTVITTTDADTANHLKTPHTTISTTELQEVTSYE